MKTLLRNILLICLTVILGQSSLRAEDLAAVKQRMKERIVSIDSLKAKQVVGENNRGYLEFVGATREKEDIVKAENRDRELVYKEIALKANSGASVDKVGRQRALKIAEIAAPGTMLQDADGAWAPKK